jgi:glycosyltransferase involved in cell wall biosynthesis
MDSDYLKAAKLYKKNNPTVKIVSGLDAQWEGSLRQYIGSIYFKLNYKKIFDFIWVSGKPQFAFALHLGYKFEKILTDLYSCDTNTFNFKAPLNQRFLFVGRFIKIKFIDGLLKAYSNLPSEIQNEWPLYLIGDGDQSSSIQRIQNTNVKIIPSLQPHELRSELSKGGIGLLTSHRDKWGVVVHEYVSMGLPIILSSGVGAATEFLIPNFNGFIFKKGDWKSLSQSMYKIATISKDELESFSRNSNLISKRINPGISASSLLSCLHR